MVDNDLRDLNIPLTLEMNSSFCSAGLYSIDILQSRKTMVSRTDWWFLNSTLCGWKDQFRNDSPFLTVSRCGHLLVCLPDFRPCLLSLDFLICPFVCAFSANVALRSFVKGLNPGVISKVG